MPLFIVGHRNEDHGWDFYHEELPESFPDQASAQSAAEEVSFREESVCAVCEVVGGSLDSDYDFMIRVVVVDGTPFNRADTPYIQHRIKGN